jgi:cell division protein FtsB
MRVLVVIGAVLLVLLQVRVWFSDVGYVKRNALRAQLELQHAQKARAAERNRALATEVAAFKSEHGLQAVEARARSDLGMVRAGETFYLIIDR